MIRTTKDLNKLVLEILIGIRDNENLVEFLNQNNSTDFADAIEHCIQRGYTDGIYLHKSVHDELSYSIPNPRLTHKGLILLEDSKL